jgi:hypothetical protein
VLAGFVAGAGGERHARGTTVVSNARRFPQQDISRLLLPFAAAFKTGREFFDQTRAAREREPEQHSIRRSDIEA